MKMANTRSNVLCRSGPSTKVKIRNVRKDWIRRNIPLRALNLQTILFFSRQDSNIFQTSINRTERGQMFWACPLTTTIKSAMHERLEPAQHVSSCSGSQNYPFYFNKPQRYSQSQPTRLHGRIVCLSVCYLKKASENYL